MVKRVALEDDLSGGPASESVSFALDRTEYEIDLNAKNAEAFRKVLDPYITRGRKVRPRSGRRQSTSAVDAKVVRSWAMQNDMAVPQRGRIPKRISEAYNQAH